MHGDRMPEIQACPVCHYGLFFNLFEVQLQCYLHIMEVYVKSAF